jgi:nucleoside phosphorylase
MDPASGGLEWGQPPVTSKATWDPQKKTLTIDMTDLANKWISGEIQNRGIILTGPEFISNSEGVHYTQSDYDGISFIIQP